MTLEFIQGTGLLILILLFCTFSTFFVRREASLFRICLLGVLSVMYLGYALTVMGLQMHRSVTGEGNWYTDMLDEKGKE